MEEFEFKRLIVWQKSMGFADDCLAITEKIKGHYRLCEQLDKLENQSLEILKMLNALITSKKSKAV